MYWKDQSMPSYRNEGNSKDPTDETGGDGKGWRIAGDSRGTCGKSPAPQLKVGIVSGLCNCTILSCPVSSVSYLVPRDSYLVSRACVTSALPSLPPFYFPPFYFPPFYLPPPLLPPYLPSADAVMLSALQTHKHPGRRHRS